VHSQEADNIFDTKYNVNVVKELRERGQSHSPLRNTSPQREATSLAAKLQMIQYRNSMLSQEPNTVA